MSGYDIIAMIGGAGIAWYFFGRKQESPATKAEREVQTIKEQLNNKQIETALKQKEFENAKKTFQDRFGTNVTDINSKPKPGN